MDTPWMSSREGAAYLRMSQTEFGRLVARGEIPCYHRGKTNFVDRRELDSLMRGRRSNGSASSSS